MSRRLLTTAAAATVALLLSLRSLPAQGDDLAFGYVPAPGPGEQPALLVTPARAVKKMEVQVEAGGQTYTFEKTNLPAGKQVSFPWKRDPSVTEATAFVRAVFSDGFVAEFNIPVQYSYAGGLKVDISRAFADVKKRTLTVQVSEVVDKADIAAYGAHKAVLDERTVDVGAGPGEIEVPWVGDPGDVVLLDVTLHGGNAWTGFTYSPWFLDIPHDDVLFDTDSDVITADQEWKLENTMKELAEVLDKYGTIVPVKLYVAGCTDTVGDGGHNKDLSNRRARAIARWLRAHGFDQPIFYYGFGETLLAVSTGDGVDEVRNRRVLYMVGANPPPAGSGIPGVGWQSL